MKPIVFLALFITFSPFGISQSVSQNGNPFSLQTNTLTTAVPFLRIAPDARSAGIGDAGIAISPNANSFYWNTSKLVFSEKRTEFSASYSPWLRNVVDDMHHVYASGYTQLGNGHAIGGAFRYFSLGNISFFDPQGNLIREFSPNELELTVGYAYRASERSAFGINTKLVYSNLTGGISAGTVATVPGTAIAVDLSYSHVNPDVSIAGKNAEWTLATTISNIGNKIAYTVESNRDFIPTNLGVGTALKVELNDHNSITSAIDFNKLLVPTPPIKNGFGQIISGKNNDVGVALGMIQSFYDAPGQVILSPSGTTQVQKGSRLKEELNEITIGGGLEYWYGDFLAIRGGYFYQHRTKGDRKYFTLGTGVHYGIFGVDVSYLAALRRTNPLANTLRFSVNIALTGKTKT